MPKVVFADGSGSCDILPLEVPLPLFVCLFQHQPVLILPYNYCARAYV